MYDWIISDTHFNHVNIVEYAGRPINHNELMQQSWRKLVQPEDTVLHLGDVLMGRQDLWPNMPGWLPGKISILTTGNHDEPHKKRWLQAKGWNLVPEFSIEYRDWTIYFTHYPLWVAYPNPNENTEVELGPYFHEDLDGQKFLNIHGHIHEKPAPSEYHINVSVEKINYQPVNLKMLLDARINLLEKI